MSMNNQKLKPIPGFPGYFATPNGQFWSAKSNKWLTIRFCRRTGYFTVHLRRNGQGNVINLHHVLLATFAGSCPKGMECRHLDGNRQNNALTNLKWGTYSENYTDSIIHGTRKGGSNGKLNHTQIHIIRHLLDSGELSQACIATYFGVRQPVISGIKNKKHYAWLS